MDPWLFLADHGERIHHSQLSAYLVIFNSSQLHSLAATIIIKMRSLLLLLASCIFSAQAFGPVAQQNKISSPSSQQFQSLEPAKSTTTTALSASPDLEVIALVAGQENYGLALVAFGEGLYSFLQAPSLSNIRVVIPPAIAAVVLAAVAGPMITSGAAESVGTGLWVATGVSMGLGASYVLRLLAPPSDTYVPKEVSENKQPAYTHDDDLGWV